MPSDMIASSPKSAKQAWPASSMRIFALTTRLHQQSAQEIESSCGYRTYPFEITVDHSLTVHIYQTLGDIS